MLIATGIFTVIAIAFITILSTVTQVQVQSSSSAVVSQESQFLLQKLQYYVETASLVDIPTSTPTSTLVLEMATSSLDPTTITLASGTMYLEQAGGALQPLTSDKVSVSNLSFTRHANPPGHDAVSISYTISYNASNAAQGFSQLFQTSIAQVSAATFDSGVYPSSAALPLGNSGSLWSPINGILYTNNSNIGIGPGETSPEQQLEVNGGIRLWPNGGVSEPTCNSSSNARGTLWFSTGGTNDALYICADVSGTVGWQQITL